MYRYKLQTQAILLMVCSIFVFSCSTVPVTGRKQLSLVPQSEMLAMSTQEYSSFLKQNKLSTDQKATSLVRTVGGKIQGAVERYFREKGMADQLNGYKWEFNLVDSKEVNAWCMPGGKVVVYTGILPVTKDDNGLAVVMGHEIAHAVAQHGNERMSQELLAQYGGMALSEALASKPAETKQLWMSAFGAGVQVDALLPFSRTQESEADRLGLIFMAMAGYDPQGAVTFWQRMAQQSGGNAPPEFLSTHPSDQSRIEKIQGELPEAMKYYKH